MVLPALGVGVAAGFAVYCCTSAVRGCSEGNCVTHYPDDNPIELAGRTVVIREQATNWTAHKIKLTIVWSPDNKVTGQSAERHEWSATSAHDECLKVLTKIVREAYKV